MSQVPKMPKSSQVTVETAAIRCFFLKQYNLTSLVFAQLHFSFNFDYFIVIVLSDDVVWM